MVAANPEPDVKEHELDNFNVHSIEEPEADSLAGCESETYGNRIHCCMVVSPAGRPLHAYRSVKELLEALRDAIAGHRCCLRMGRFFIGIFPKTTSSSQSMLLKESRKED
jgi:hypothetical protein